MHLYNHVKVSIIDVLWSKAIGFFLQIVGNWKHKTDAWPYGRREPGGVKCLHTCCNAAN